MSRRKMLWAALVAVPLAVSSGLVYAGTQKASGYVCPITGETLACSDCCPLNAEKATSATEITAKPKKTQDGYICPLTGEKLNCERCCPLNDKK